MKGNLLTRWTILRFLSLTLRPTSAQLSRIIKNTDQKAETKGGHKKDLQTCRTGVGQQVAQLHASWMMMIMMTMMVVVMMMMMYTTQRVQHAQVRSRMHARTHTHTLAYKCVGYMNYYVEHIADTLTLVHNALVINGLIEMIM